MINTTVLRDSEVHELFKRFEKYVLEHRGSYVVLGEQCTENILRLIPLQIFTEQADDTALFSLCDPINTASIEL
ncbi:MAG: hypothetical protein MRQ07_03520 [Candidatus Midichloria sp.]|nr:hypothetical protein [Candidatus Midichloria sp.]